nr:tRNA (adenine(37)-N6)-methyltransferase-like isoform X1 [Penaeus vannamei]XP_027212809.1 tRNA (adenine(37)-N6)-methyltransferase-like isoform X1 [Penaeus vannamei]XP_027212810.1 tRNA (adenine(37)-N6)-methyltransferase-like isoform X1 [Penaeus vannamei]
MSSYNCTNTDPGELKNQLGQARNELNNIRKSIQGLRAQFRKDISRLEEMSKLGKFPSMQLPLPERNSESENKRNQKEYTEEGPCFHGWQPIGYIKSWFRHKNGTPRQGSVTTLSRGTLKIDKAVFNNPHHSLEGLDEYSHIWIFFIFNKNGEIKDGNHVKSKVAPPRLNGKRIGVFATRSPHRPNPLGLTLAHVEYIKEDCIYLSGLDILDGTPVVDIKPYIPEYDCPQLEGLYASPSLSDSEVNDNAKYPSKDNIEAIKNDTFSIKSCDSDTDVQSVSCVNLESRLPVSERNSESKESVYQDGAGRKYIGVKNCQQVTTAEWLHSVHSSLQVIYNPIAADEIKRFSAATDDEPYRLQFLRDDKELKNAIRSVLSEDPRSTYRREKCPSLLYYLTVDTAHVTAWFDDTTVEVLRVRPVKNVAVMQENCDK